ncbi:MAG: DMT family transporter [Ancalomicrobiaceae bacterium]|nr:DMT family transporter [Ancalomicrobiaceae bacterium]
MTETAAQPAVPPELATSRRRIDPMGLAAILIGTGIIAWSGVFVRFADVGPLTSAAWRLIIALPGLVLWMALLGRRTGEAVDRPAVSWRSLFWPVIGAGLGFTLDVATFHFALFGTSITNATFIGNIAPIFAVIGGLVFFGERPERRVWGALAMSLFGGWVMAGVVAPSDLHAGDLWALAAAFGYASYLLFIKSVRQVLAGPAATLWPAIVSAIVLVIWALITEPVFLPHSLSGWLAVVALGIGSHTLGQGLTSIAMGRVPVGVIAIVLLAQSPVSALLAYLVVGEEIAALQILGGGIILAALVIARPR